MSTKGNGVSQNGDIKTYLNLNLKMLSYIGIVIDLREYPVVEQAKFLKKIPTLLIIALQFYLGVCQIFIITEAIKDDKYSLATQVASDIFINVLCITKGFRLVTTSTEVNTALQELASVWQEYVPQHIGRGKVFKKAARTLLFCKVFVTVTFGSALSFGFPALRNSILLYAHCNVANYTCDYSERVFFIKYPFAINNPITYFFVVLEEEYLLLAAALFWSCGDTLFAQLTTHASLHFEMLRYDIDSLMDNETSDFVLIKNLVIFIKRHKKLLRICNRIEEIYSPVVLVTVLISSINMCFNMFELSETINSRQYLATVYHFLVLISIFLQIMFYCIFAETLTKHVSAVGDGIYKSKWADKNHKIKLYVQMLIIKSQKSFYCTAYGFFPIGHTRLTMVLKTAFSYYMMLRATA